MDNFFPEDYNVPKSGTDFMKFEKGENVFRVLDSVHMGYEYWTEDKKVQRSYTPITELPPNAAKRENKKTKEMELIPAKHIWIIPVWNYLTKSIQILTISQKTVQEAILALGRDKDWGAPTKYDLKVVRTGDGFDTDYNISPKPQKELEPEIAEAYAKDKETIQKTIADLFA